MIVVTAPTGDIGHRVVRHVLDGDEPVRVIVRDPSRLSADVRERVEVVAGSHADAGVVSAAFDGADTLFWLVPADVHATSVHDAYVEFARPAVHAIRARGVQRVVDISALGRGTPVADHAGHVTASLAMDDLLATSGAHLRVLTMPSFMDNLLNQAQAIKEQGMFFSPMSADRTVPTVATRDIAAVAARLLLDHAWTGQAETPVLGPEDLSNDDLAAIMSDVLGRTIEFQQIPGEAFTRQLTGFGMSDAMARAMLDMVVAKDNGLDNAAERTPETSTPTTFRQWCEDTLKPAVEG